MHAMTELAVRQFRHKIGDALYDLFTDPDGQTPDAVVMWPVIRVTKCYVWVNGPRRWNRDRVYQFSRDDLELRGRGWNQRHRMALYVRPLPDWPVLLVDSRVSEQAAITEGVRP
jgi:hypothetical protein